MSRKNPYKGFVGRYLARGAVGVSVGLAAVAPSAAKQADPSGGEKAQAATFSEHLSAIRSAVSQHEDQQLAQVLPHPFPNAQPFKNFFGKQPFADTFKNTAGK